MELERKYLMKATVKVCFKDTEPCDQEAVIFDNILVTKQPCEYNATYLQPGNISKQELIFTFNYVSVKGSDQPPTGF